MRHVLCLMTFVLLFSSEITAQKAERNMGPVIENFGPVFSVENPDFVTDTSKVYKVVFDVHDTPEDRTKVNPMLNTLARFLNMHAQAGVPIENLKVACVIHNKASHDVLNNEGYRAKFGVDNPNVPLLAALKEVGAAVYICGQSIAAREVDRNNLAESVKVGLSAMTVILSLESEGYTLIKF